MADTDRQTIPWPDAVRLDHQRANIEADHGGILLPQEIKSTLRYVSLDFVTAALAGTANVDDATAEMIVEALR
jgi:hypothetical protein